MIQNPPFGVQNKHADKEFLLAAMRSGRTIYSIHKIESKQFIQALAKEHGYQVVEVLPLQFPLGQTFGFHTTKKYLVKTGLWKLEK